MPKLYLVDKRQTICEITDEQLKLLRELLVDEDSQDREYFVDKDTLEMLKDEGFDETVLKKIEEALGDVEGIELGWSA